MRKFVTVDGRRFVIKFWNNGEPKIIHERKVREVSPGVEQYYDDTYWHPSQRPIGPPGSITRRIVEAARDA